MKGLMFITAILWFVGSMFLALAHNPAWIAFFGIGIMNLMFAISR